VFEEELERVFRRGWICVGRVQDVPEPGDHFQATVAGEQLLIIRGLDGRVRAISNICRHRWTPLTSTPGNLRMLRCPYHNWTYDPTGRFLGASHMKDSLGVLEERGCDLPAFACEDWEGWLFVNLAGNQPPIAAALAPLSAQIARWDVARMVRLADPIVYVGRYNWKVLADNAGDCYHVIGTHAVSTMPHVDYKNSTVTSDEGSYSRTTFPSRYPASEIGYFGLPAATHAEFSGAWNYSVWPTHFFGVTTDFVVWEKVDVLGVDRLRIELTLLGTPEIRETEGFEEARDRLIDSIREVEQEDQDIMNAVGSGLRSRSAAAAPFSPLEEGAWNFERWWLERMTPSES
jgi:phenylpropionate dioxygenase-like ring-hydroxylating dioxygenase large terminal subunit